jgi:hypothetical protein
MLAIADKTANAMMSNYLTDSSSIHWLHKINAAITQILRPKQAAATHLESRVVTSINKISNALAFFYCITSSFHVHSFVRESWLWHVFLPRLDSYVFRDALQNAKQLFSFKLPLMTQYFVMRECENILSRYLCVVTTAFSWQD